nr:NADH dehydrogenase subunit 2 [Pteromalus puparum]AYM35238.1 NADH dehydrogenase subunit 2 [Pteromalus puparum]
MNYYCYIFFLPMLMVTNLMMFISTSWFSMWMIMEINMISFISLIIFDKNIKSEMFMNYFLVQTLNSYFFLFSSILINYINMVELMLLMMNLSMLNKLGMPPFYMWYLKIMKNLNWMNVLILSIFQKIIPLLILNNVLMYKFSMIFNLVLMMLSGLYSSIKGLSQSNLKIIFCYSSIVQMGWIIIMLIFSEMMCINYFMIYTFIMINLIMLLSNYNINNLNNMQLIKLNNKINYYLMNMCIFSLASMPPFFGFMMKLIVIKTMYYYLPMIMLLMLIMNSLISMFFYFRLLFNNIMINSMSNKLNYKFINQINKYNYKILLFSWLSIILLMMYEIM